MRKVEISTEHKALTRGFTIARGRKTQANLLVVRISADGISGRGEAVPYARYGETLEKSAKAIEAIADDLRAGMSRAQLQNAMPASAARAAIDCALWDLEARLAGETVWAQIGNPPPAPITTAYTITIDTPDAMTRAARDATAAGYGLLKVKLGQGSDIDMARLAGVRAGAPNARLICDMNEGWSTDDLARHAAALAECGLELVEQPLAAGADSALADFDLPFCADESAHDCAGFSEIAPYYQWVNIKLEKTGGLTEALALRDMARAAGKRVMVGCMVASSLAMAPAHILAQTADLADIDGALWLAEDRPHGLVYKGDQVAPPTAELWGG